ncbi:MAG: UvrD/REP helicase [Myxococcales bacterium]|nr:UvrD/REP helicase [Myxococcales bacterium]
MDRPILNPEQRAAVEHGDGPLMVLAGAGTGKTRVLVTRIARLVETGAEPWSILAVTFTNKAAAEMRNRLRELLGARADAMWIGTFHATCARLLRKHGQAVGLTKSFVIFDDDDQMKLVEKLLKETGFDEQVSARTVLSRFDRAKNRGVDPREAKVGIFDDVIDKIYPMYQAQLAKENAVDFNDLILKTLALFDPGSRSESDPLRRVHEETARSLQVRFRHVLVDEFQDTNRVQYDLVSKLAEATRNLTVVGDDDQSIYAWRGAEPRNLLDFDRDFADATVIKLEQNYRSTQMILDAANGIIRHNRDRHEKSLWTDHTGGELIEIYQAGDERGEAYYVAQTIRRMLDEGPHSPSDIAILYRTNAQSRVLEEHLRAARVPAKVVGAQSFFERKEVKDVVAYLRILANPAADSAFERVVNAPARGIGEATVDRLRAAARSGAGSILDAAKLAARAEVAGIGTGPRKKLHQFVELLDGLRDVISHGASVAETIIQVVDRSGMRAKLEAEDSSESRDRLDNLAELVTIASDFDEESDEPQPIEAFLERIALSAPADTDHGSRAAGSETVTLMTIHIAKGLEWPAVFITGLEDGLFPSLRERDGQSEDAGLEEERRLAYVAITRARQHLILTHARTRRVWGEIRLQGPSRFLDDLPKSVLAQPMRPGALTPKAPAIVDGNWSGVRRRSIRSSARGAIDEFDQRLPDDEPVYRVDADVPPRSVLRTGDQVTHTMHGVGRVVAVSGDGGDTKVIVEFPEAGRKTIFAKFLRFADDGLN